MQLSNSHTEVRELQMTAVENAQERHRVVQANEYVINWLSCLRPSRICSHISQLYLKPTENLNTYDTNKHTLQLSEKVATHTRVPA